MDDGKQIYIKKKYIRASSYKFSEYFFDFSKSMKYNAIFNLLNYYFCQSPFDFLPLNIHGLKLYNIKFNNCINVKKLCIATKKP